MKKATLFLLMILFLLPYAGHAADSCSDCHGDPRKMGAAGFPQFVFSSLGVNTQTRMPASCSDCHLGDPAAANAVEAHQTMVTLQVVRQKTWETAIIEAHRKGPHNKVDCAACHTTRIGGYAFNFWSAVGPSGRENPLTRIQDYVTGATVPLLVRNPRGVWIPVHAVTALIRNLDDKDHDVMAWLNLDRVAHATGKARTCESCHASPAQHITVKYSGGSYKDVEDGRYTIVADEKGLR